MLVSDVQSSKGDGFKPTWGSHNSCAPVSSSVSASSEGRLQDLRHRACSARPCFFALHFFRGRPWGRVFGFIRDGVRAGALTLSEYQVWCHAGTSFSELYGKEYMHYFQMLVCTKAASHIAVTWWLSDPSVTWFPLLLSDFFGAIGDWDHIQIIKRNWLALFSCCGH